MHIAIKSFIASIALMGIAGVALAQSGETPATLEGAKTISPAEAKALIEKGALAVDVRKKAAFVEGRLPKAKSIGALRNADTKEFPAEAFGGKKDMPIIVYGHGSDGWSAVAAVQSAVKQGYTNVNWMRTGWADWSKSGLPVEQ